MALCCLSNMHNLAGRRFCATTRAHHHAKPFSYESPAVLSWPTAPRPARPHHGGRTAGGQQDVGHDVHGDVVRDAVDERPAAPHALPQRPARRRRGPQRQLLLLRLLLGHVRGCPTPNDKLGWLTGGPSGSCTLLVRRSVCLACASLGVLDRVLSLLAWPGGGGVAGGLSQQCLRRSCGTWCKCAACADHAPTLCRARHRHCHHVDGSLSATSEASSPCSGGRPEAVPGCCPCLHVQRCTNTPSDKRSATAKRGTPNPLKPCTAMQQRHGLIDDSR